MSSKYLLEPETEPAQVFRYPCVPGENASESGEEANRKRLWNASVGAAAAPEPVSTEQKEQQLRLRGFEEGKAAARGEFDSNLLKARQEIVRTVREFAGERDTYFQLAEAQLVRLALAIVRKILHRESQIDPLLLTGILRVALEKIEGSSSIKLRANPGDIKIWREYFAQTTEKFPTPELVGDAGLEPLRCILETELGTTEIGLETQLKEIEQGFLDLLAQKPGTRG